MRSSAGLRIVVLLGALVVTSLHHGAAAAADYPTRLIRIIVPFPPGGNPDLAARVVAHRMSVDFGQPVVIDNRPGVNGGIGTSMAAKAEADGYTLLVANLGVLGINPGIYEKLAYDPGRDLMPISRVATSPLLLITAAATPLDSVTGLIAAAKQDPGRISYSSSGVGSAAHLAGALFDQMAGTRMLHVPYKGAPEATAAVAGNIVSAVFGGQGPAWALVATGQARPLALSGPTRSPRHPATPTVAEAGVPGYGIVDWVGILAPAGTPNAIVTVLNAEVTRALADPDTRERLALQDLEPAPTTSAEFAAFIAAEQARWREVARRSNIRIAP